ncbi:MAG: hypothetical protein JWN14_4207 [Chthonomonadales bacterium]|nr:hypothetical protein [Chthonomonadales bacterium]
MRRSRAIKWLASLLLLGTAGGILALIQPPERLLLSRSTLVARSDRFEQYNWQSDHSLFLFQQRHERPYPWLCAKLDLHTGQSTFNLPFKQPFERQSIRVSDYETSFVTSPDGKWLLWTRTDGEGMTLHATGWLANIETGHIEHFPLGLHASGFNAFTLDRLYWLADCQHFAELDFHRSLTTLYNVNALQQTMQMQHSSKLHLADYSGIQVNSEERLLAVTRTSYAPVNLLYPPPDLIQTNLQGDPLVTQSRPLALPNMTLLLADVAFSPHGDRYAIAALVGSHPAWLDMLQRWKFPVRIPSHPQVGIWILTPDGKQQEVGHMPPVHAESPFSQWSYEMPHALRWSPDGKQLGFVFKGDLYRVPTN